MCVCLLLLVLAFTVAIWHCPLCTHCYCSVGAEQKVWQMLHCHSLLTALFSVQSAGHCPLLYSVVILQLLLFVYTIHATTSNPSHFACITPIAPCFSLFFTPIFKFLPKCFYCQNQGNFIATYLRGNINVGPHE